MAKKNSPESGNPVVVALKSVFGPLAERSAALPPALAYGLPVLVTILLIAVLKTTLTTNIAWLFALAIVAPLAVYIVTLKDVRDKKVSTEPPWAEIESPKPGKSVD